MTDRLAPTSSITDVSFAWPSVDELWATLLLQAGFNSAAVAIGATLLGASAGIVGTFALLRKRALMSDALAHSALPGLAVAFILAYLLGYNPRSLTVLLLGATLSGILGVLCVQGIVRSTRLKEDAAIGIVLSVFFGAGIVLLSIIQSMGTGAEGGLGHFIYGQTAAMRATDAKVLLCVTLITAICAVCFLKEFRLVSFDQDFAQALGWPVSLIDLIMMTLLVVVTVVGLQTVGIILIVALLVVPAASARFWTERLSIMTALGALIGGASGYAGAVMSSLLPRLPAGAVIVLCAGVFFVFSFLFAPCRGVIAMAYRLIRLRINVANEHLLRDMYEQIELRSKVAPSQLPPSMCSLLVSELPILRSWSQWFAAFVLRGLSSKGFVQHSEDTLCLTAKGLHHAAIAVRNHRLWEEYLITHADIAASHVDRSADVVEHVLSPEIVNQLEAALVAKGRLPNRDNVPLASVHPLEGHV